MVEIAFDGVNLLQCQIYSLAQGTNGLIQVEAWGHDGSIFDLSFTSAEPTQETVTVTTLDTPISFPSAEGFGSVTSSDGQTTYTEGTDYTVDNANKTITPLSGGQIAQGQELTVNYSQESPELDPNPPAPDVVATTLTLQEIAEGGIALFVEGAEGWVGCQLFYSRDEVDFFSLTTTNRQSTPDGGGGYLLSGYNARFFFESADVGQTLYFRAVSTGQAIGDVVSQSIVPTVAGLATKIDSFSPTTGQIGDALNIFGQGFTGATSAAINGVDIDKFAVIDDGTITGNVAEGTTAGFVTVKTAQSPAQFRIGALDYVRWRGEYVQAVTYFPNDLVTSGGTLAIAQVETEEDPQVIPIGDQEWRPIGDTPTWTTQNVSANQIRVGIRLNVLNDGYLNGIGIWIPTQAGNVELQVIRIDDPLTTAGVSVLYPRQAVTPNGSRLELPLSPELFLSGASLDIVAILYSVSGEFTTNANWQYVRSNGAPNPGEAWHSSDGNYITFHKTDSDSTDQTALLEGLNPGDEIKISTQVWSVVGIAITASDVQVKVDPKTRAASDGLYNFEFTTYGAATLNYFEELGTITEPNVSGLFAVDDADFTVSNNAHGLDLLVQDAQISSAWDYLAITSGVSSGGGFTDLFGSVYVEAPTDTTSIKIPVASNFVINSLKGAAVDTGTCTVAVKINGVAVTGLESVSVTTTPQNITVTANAVDGDLLTWEFSSVSGAEGFRGSLSVSI